MTTETAHHEFPIYHIDEANTLNDPIYNFRGFTITIKGFFAIVGAIVVLNWGLHIKKPAIGNIPLPLLPSVAIALTLIAMAFYPPRSTYLEYLILKGIHIKIASLFFKEKTETEEKAKKKPKKRKIIYIRKKTSETAIRTTKVDERVYNRAVFVSKQIKKL